LRKEEAKLFWKFLNKAATETEPESVELRIEGDIVSNDDAWFYEWLGIAATTPNAFKEALKVHANKPITVWIDSYGGDVFAAAGIYNALMEHKGPVTVKIDGKAMSAASVIAMAGGEILMSPMAIMMIHNPLTYAEGDMHDLRHTADILDQVKEAIVNAYQLKTNKSRAKISEMMNAETFMNAKAAIKDGFADAMMYADGEKPVKDIAASMSFGRLAVINSASGSMKRLIEIRDAQPKPPPDPPPGPDIETIRAKLALAIVS
jgi:ATP-dependent Clp protease protease subunit